MAHQFNPDDRVLVLQTECHGALRLREWARSVPQGLVVGLGDQNVIRNARRELADCENILFTSGTRDEIPWRDCFFTVIFDTEGEAGAPGATKDMLRVLHATGRIYSIQP